MKYTGERQVSKHFSQVRKDHRERYNLLLDLIESETSILDVGCGIGYGSFFLASLSPCSRITAIDISPDAVNFASCFYTHEKITFSVSDILADTINGLFDITIAFEVIEHVDNPSKFLQAIDNHLTESGLFVVSTPNEEVLHFSPDVFPFHQRHYTSMAFKEMLSDAGFSVIQEFSQVEDYPTPGFGGKYNIAICRKKLYVEYQKKLSILAESLELFYKREYESCINTILENNLCQDIKKALFYVGSAYEKLNQYRVAVDYLKEAEKHLDNFDINLKGAVYYHLAYCLNCLSNNIDSIRCYQKCLEYIPDHKEAIKALQNNK